MIRKRNGYLLGALFAALWSSVAAAAPSAPVQLSYELPPAIVANQPVEVELTVDTRARQGALLLEIAGQTGVTLLDDSRYRFDLNAHAERPIRLVLRVLPGDRAERFIAILVTLETEMGPMVRTFRVDIEPGAAANLRAQERAIRHR